MTSGPSRPRTMDLISSMPALVPVDVPRRADALATMVAVPRPGGWLLLEEADPGLQPLVCPDEYGPAQELAEQTEEGLSLADPGMGCGPVLRPQATWFLREAGAC